MVYIKAKSCGHLDHTPYLLRLKYNLYLVVLYGKCHMLILACTQKLM